MKKGILAVLLIAAVIFFTGPGCKKFGDSTSYETKINFTYNGQQQSRSSTIYSDIIIVQNEILFVNFTGLGIKDENNLFGGDIYITARNPGAIVCGYLQPTGSSVSSTGANCNLHSGGNPIDSVAVYWYESGSINFTYSDCKDVTAAIVPGQKDCAINGTFDLVLTNKNNQKMRLTNGSFSGRMRKYP